MRILQVHNHYRQRGGEDAVVEAEAKLLLTHGHHVVPYRVRNPPGHIAAIRELASASWNKRAARRLISFIGNDRIDLAHVHNTWFALSPSIIEALAIAQIPVVMTLHNFRVMCANAMLLRQGQPCELCVGRWPWPAVRYRCYHDSLLASAAAAYAIAFNAKRHTWERNVDRFVALTEFGKRKFVAGGIPAQKIDVKPHFIADPGPREKDPASSNVVLFVGRLSPEKGLEVLLKAWQLASIPRLKLVIIGDGPLLGELHKEQSAQISITGPLKPSQVREHMLGARVLVFPSLWYETFGLTIVEALSAGLPVIASDLGGTLDLLGPSSRHWLFKPGDSTDLAAKLWMLNDDSTVNAGGLESRQRYLQCFTPEQGIMALENLYESVLQRKRVGASAENMP